MGEAFSFDTDPGLPPIPREPDSAAWAAPNHRLFDVHTILTLLYVLLAVGVWLSSDERFVEARMPILLFGLGVVGPYWYGKSK